MYKRSGKIQFLFWTFFFSILLYVWIVWIGVQVFVLPDEPIMELPQNYVALLFILYGFLVITTLAGTIISIMIGNKHYSNLFGTMIIIVFGTILASKGLFG